MFICVENIYIIIENVNIFESKFFILNISNTFYQTNRFIKKFFNKLEKTYLIR